MENLLERTDTFPAHPGESRDPALWQNARRRLDAQWIPASAVIGFTHHRRSPPFTADTPGRRACDEPGDHPLKAPYLQATHSGDGPRIGFAVRGDCVRWRSCEPTIAAFAGMSGDGLVRPIEPAGADDRFKNLLGATDWAALPPAVRARFSAKPKVGEGAIFRGRTTRLHMNMAGRVFATLARLIGAPLPVDERCDQCDAVVAVTDAAGGEGQVWTRLYARPDGFPQAIHSMKKFAGPTGLEEHVVNGRLFGLGMTLSLSVAGGALFFSSADYFVRLARWRARLPSIFAPGAMVIGHHDLGAGRFLFTLTLNHPLFGLMVDQETVFEDMEARHG